MLLRTVHAENMRGGFFLDTCISTTTQRILVRWGCKRAGMSFPSFLLSTDDHSTPIAFSLAWRVLAAVLTSGLRRG